ncbi:alpha/beta hydrolase [Propionibacterium freudenreichii]|nr:alpha/beta hydrolase [Propionibacterium freudenreichii]
MQIVHGLGEHSRRYLHMITALLDAGFVVAADDHAGTARPPPNRGCGRHRRERRHTVISDEYSLHKLVRDDHPTCRSSCSATPGGSMIARGFASAHGATLSGLALCGVAAQIDGVETKLDRVGWTPPWLPAPAPRRVRSSWARSSRTSSRATPMCARPNDWIALGPRCGGRPCARPVQQLLQADEPALRARLRHPVRPGERPRLVHLDPRRPAGARARRRPGPGGQLRRGAYHVANQLEASGHRDVRTHVYTGYRHEVHNEPPDARRRRE